MTVANQNFLVYRGTDVLFAFSAFPPTDITAWTAQLSIRDVSSSTVSLTKTATPTDITNGVWQVPLSRTETLGLTSNVYTLDLSRTNSGEEAVLATARLLVQGTAKDP